MAVIKKKPFVLSVASILLILTVAAISTDIIISRLINKDDLPAHVINFCKNNLGRAITFDKAELTLLGNINIQAINLSYGSDFNDNISFIKAKEACCSLDLFELLRGSVKINSVTFKDAEIFLLKSYGKTYSETFKTLITLPDTVQNLEHVNPEKLTLKFANTTLVYREFFKDEQVEISCREVTASFNKRSDIILYSANGLILTQGNTAGCKISVEGKTVRSKDGQQYCKIKIKDFDLSRANRHIKEYSGLDADISGLISSTARIISDENSKELSLSAKTKELSVSDASRCFLSKGNISVEILLNTDKAQGILEIKSLKLQDKNIDIGLSAKKQELEDVKNISVNFRIGEMNMARVSEYFKPFKDTMISGRIYGSGKAFINCSDDKETYIKATASVRDLTIIKDKQRIISSGNGHIDLENRKLSLDSSFVTRDSDFKINLNSDIKHFIPLTSGSSLKIRSKNLSALLAAKIAAFSIDTAYDSAYKDGKTGYHETFFLQRPISAYINNNNIETEWTADRLLFRDKAALSGFKLTASLEKGILSSKEFALAGYGGEYLLQFGGFFNRDYPTVQIKLDVSRMDLNALAADMNAPYGLGGILDISCSYELHAYRMFHMLQNSIGSMSVSLKSGSLKNTGFQKKFNDWLNLQGLDGADIGSLNINSLNMQLVQYGGTFSFRTLSIMTDKADCYGYGSYSWDGGINLPFSLTLKGENTGKTERFLLAGPILNPNISLQKRKTEKSERFNILNKVY